MTEEFGTKLKKIRISRNMSQEDLAKFLGTSKQVISRYETNQRTPKITTAQEYAFKLNVPLLYLVDNTITSIEEISQHFLPFTISKSIPDLAEAINLYKSLDEIDRSEIRGEMKGMLRADKYKSKIKDESAG